MKLKSLFGLILPVVVASSCSKSFLDKEPLGVLSTATLQSDTSVLGMALNRIYGTIAWREYGIGRQQFSTHEMCADDFIPGSDANMAFYQNYTYLSSDGYVQQYWDRTYQNIHYCNVVTDATNGDPSKALYEAQAKFFRAYYNFDLTNVFGDVPLRDHDPAVSEYNIPKSTHAEIIALVESDLKYAIANLPTRSQWGTAQNGRVSKGTAQGLLAKVYLYDQKYDSAKLYADSVINGGEYSLFTGTGASGTSYRSVFGPDQLYSSENMLPGGYMYTTAIAVGRSYNPYLQYQGLPSLGGNAVIVPSTSLVNEYETGDPRKTASIFTPTDVVDGYNNNAPVAFPTYAQYANKKVIWPYSYWNGNFSFQNLNPMFLRYADIVLIDAEASNETGNTADALKYLEQIRARARGNMTFQQTIDAGLNGGAGILPTVTTTNKTQLRLAIWHERRVELAMEFGRWFDLVRYNKVAAADGSDGTGYTENLLKNVYGRSNFDYAKFSHFPLPATYVTSSNGVLVQNSNW